jgi:hypothetical protein
MPVHLQKALENGGNITLSELEENEDSGANREIAGRREGREVRKGKAVVDWWYRWVFVM